jgi:ADP-heptose:LPS heptosyltransferase
MHVASGLLFRAFDGDRLLARAARRGVRRFATAWLRGLGDVPFIVGEFVRYVRQRVPGAEVSVLVRPGLEDACRWIEGVHRVIVIEEWSRQATLASRWGLAFPPPWEIRRALAQRGLSAAYDAVLPYPLGRWYERDARARRPRLCWSEPDRRFGRDFIGHAFPEAARFVVALNTRTGTGPYYDFDKEWGLERFGGLMRALLERVPDSRLVLIDAQKVDGLPLGPRVLDTRGTLGVAQSISVAAAADLFVGLDAAAANLLYFLEGVALELIVLLGRTSCFTPLRYPPASPGVRLTAVCGTGERIHAVGLETVLAAVRAARARRHAAACP